MLQFIGLANYYRDHVPNMTEMVKLCQQAISNYQELYFLEDTATPILQTDASDCGIGGYLYMVTNGKVRVIRFFSKALTGPQLNWSTREKESKTLAARLSRTYSTIFTSS